MGSVQKRELYDKLHKQFGDKYSIHPRYIAYIRSNKITSGKTKQQIILQLAVKLNNKRAEVQRLSNEIPNIEKAITELSHMDEAQFEDLTKKV